MKFIATLIFAFLSVVLVTAALGTFWYFELRGLWIIVEFAISAIFCGLAHLTVKSAQYFELSRQSDVHIRAMYKQYSEFEPGPVALDCPSRELADEFWRVYKGGMKNRIYDRQKYDSVHCKLRFKKTL